MKSLLFLIIIYAGSAFGMVDFSFIRTYVSNLVDDKELSCAGKPPKDMCDENQVMLHLARMYIVSPERVLILLTADSLPETCKNLQETIARINKTQSGCVPLSPENLYMKLLRTVKFFEASICRSDSHMKKKISKIGDCLPELREEFLDCEATPDWYENINETLRCLTLNDIANCNYVRTAMLCGLESAAVVRAFTSELFQQVFPTSSKCKVSRSLPVVDDPMSSAHRSHLNALLKQAPFCLALAKEKLPLVISLYFVFVSNSFKLF